MCRVKQSSNSQMKTVECPSYHWCNCQFRRMTNSLIRKVLTGNLWSDKWIINPNQWKWYLKENQIKSVSNMTQDEYQYRLVCFHFIQLALSQMNGWFIREHSARLKWLEDNLFHRSGYRAMNNAMNCWAVFTLMLFNVIPNRSYYIIKTKYTAYNLTFNLIEACWSALPVLKVVNQWPIIRESYISAHWQHTRMIA